MQLAPVLGHAAPWMIALESQLQAINMMNRAVDLDIKKREMWRIDYQMLTAATPYSWNSEVTKAVLAASHSIPSETTIDSWNLDTNAIWWYFDDPLPFSTVNVDGNGVFSERAARTGVRALCMAWVGSNSESITFPAGSNVDDVNKALQNGLIRRDLCCSVWIDDVLKELPILPSQAMLWAEHETLTHMVNGSRRVYRKNHPQQAGTRREDIFAAATDGLARFILAGLAWLGQKVIIESDGHIERHRRKDFNKRTGQELTNIRVISLRKSEHGVREVGDHNSVEWSCRWTVDGHWRNQPVGINRSERRLTWINPYVKGPDDKELRVPKRKVYVVNR